MQVETLFSLTLPNKVADMQEWIKIIGLSPLSFCVKGQRVSDKPHARISEEPFMTSGIRRQKESTVETQVNKLIDQLYTRRAEINHLVNTLDLEVNCASFAWAGENKELVANFDAGTLKKITELGSDFSLTRYRY